MELKRYLQIIAANWWIVLAAFMATFSAVFLLTLGQTPIYRSVATYVVKANLNEPDARTLSSALDLLSRGQIAPTIAEVANSQLIKAQAAGTLGLTGTQVRDIAVMSRPLAGTNVVEVAVEGPIPALNRDFASAVGANTATFVQRLYGIYELEMLDQPTTPSSPSKPRLLFNLLLGAVGGLLLGAGLAFIFAYLRVPEEEEDAPESEATVTRTARAAAEY